MSGYARDQLMSVSRTPSLTVGLLPRADNAGALASFLFFLIIKSKQLIALA